MLAAHLNFQESFESKSGFLLLKTFPGSLAGVAMETGFLLTQRAHLPSSASWSSDLLSLIVLAL